jgi:hypothetical protein
MRWGVPRREGCLQFHTATVTIVVVQKFTMAQAVRKTISHTELIAPSKDFAARSASEAIHVVNLVVHTCHKILGMYAGLASIAASHGK